MEKNKSWVTFNFAKSITYCTVVTTHMKVRCKQIFRSLFPFLLSSDETKKSGRRLLGDVHFAEARKRASWITPVPGGR